MAYNAINFPRNRRKADSELPAFTQPTAVQPTVVNYEPCLSQTLDETRWTDLVPTSPASSPFRKKGRPSQSRVNIRINTISWTSECSF
jgi:hypothetical protein